MTNPTEPASLKPHHLDALRALHANNEAQIAPAILGMLRKRGLAGKLVGHDNDMRQKTRSPLTDEGRAAIGVTS